MKDDMNDGPIDKSTYWPCPKCGEPMRDMGGDVLCDNYECTDSGGNIETGKIKETGIQSDKTIATFRQFCEAHEDFTDDQIREFLEDMAIAIVTEALRDG